MFEMAHLLTMENNWNPLVNITYAPYNAGQKLVWTDDKADGQHQNNIPSPCQQAIKIMPKAI